MKVFENIAISGSALTAESLRLDVIANNLANINTTRTPQGGPYQRQAVSFAQNLENAGLGDEDKPLGVRVANINNDPAPFKMTYEPTHPDADEEGYVAYPNIDVTQEMTDLISATRSYEANTSVLNATKDMYMKALEIGR